MSDRAERFGPTRRGGPIFRWLGEPLAVDLANTVMVVRDSEEVDLLVSADDLGEWLHRERERLGECAFATDHLAEVRELRDSIRPVLAAAADRRPLPSDALRHVNSASTRCPVAAQLSAGEDGTLSLVNKAENQDSLDWLLGTLARSAIELLGGTDRGRLNVCLAPSCGMFFVGARRWCCSACGNRARAARHYRRAKEESRSQTKAPSQAPVSSRVAS